MTLKELSRVRVYRDPDDPAGGEEAPVEAPAEVQIDFNDPAIQEEVARRAGELAQTQIVQFKQDFQRQQTPQLPPLQKTPQQLRQEKVDALKAAATYDDQLSLMVDMIEQAKEEGSRATMERLRPLIKHSAVQSATSVVANTVKVAPEIRPYIESVVDEMGFDPDQLHEPKNAKLVADAAAYRAWQAGQTSTPAQDTTKGGTLFTQPRTPVSAPAPAVSPTNKTWRDGASPDEQRRIEEMIHRYTPPGMKPEDAFPPDQIEAALREMRYQAQISFI